MLNNFETPSVSDLIFSSNTYTLQFCMNEFGIMEVVDEDENNKQSKDGIGDKENVCLIQNSSKSSPITMNNASTEKKREC